jgi:hypothetical protein
MRAQGDCVKLETSSERCLGRAVGPGFAGGGLIRFGRRALATDGFSHSLRGMMGPATGRRVGQAILELRYQGRLAMRRPPTVRADR